MLHKQADQSWDEFQRYWRDEHGPIAARMLGLRGYVPNHATDRGNVPYAVAEHRDDRGAADHLIPPGASSAIGVRERPGGRPAGAAAVSA